MERSPLRKQKEAEIQKQIINCLKLCGYLVFKHRNVGIYKQSTGKYIPLSFREKGISGIIALSPLGKFISIEVKRKGGKPSPEQLAFLAEVQARHGIGILAYRLDDALHIFAGTKSRMTPKVL